MKRTLFLLLLCLTFSLSACGVSQEDYDAVVEENSSLQSEVELLKSEVATLSSEKETLESEVESISAQAKELLDEKAELVLSELTDSYGKAWATTSFGDNSICFTDSDSTYLQCIAGKTYNISEDGISALWSDYLKAFNTLSVVNMVDNTLPYKTISVKFLDPSGVCILDISLKNNNGAYTLDSIMCNVLYSNEIGSALSKLGS